MIQGVDRAQGPNRLKINDGALQTNVSVEFRDGRWVQVVMIPMRSGVDAFECEIPLIEGRFVGVLPRFDTSPPAGTVNIVLTEMLPDRTLGRVITKNAQSNGAFVTLGTREDFILNGRVRINVSNMGANRQLTLICYVHNMG